MNAHVRSEKLDMRRGKGLILGLLLLTSHVALLTPELHAKGKGTTAANFLKIGASGRQSAMGDAAVGLADDANAGLINPAAWGRLRRHEASFLRTEWLEGISYTGAVYGHSTQRHGGWGASLLWLDYPEIQGYDAGGFSDRSIEAADRVMSVGHGREWGAFALGLNAKLVQQELDGIGATAVAGDAGAHWRTGWLEGPHKLDVGLALRNLGQKVKFIEKSADLPASTELGAAYRGWSDTLNLDLDLAHDRDAGLRWRLGGEYWIKRLLAVRLGFTPRDAGAGFSFGIGLRVRQAHLDYAIANFGALEAAHRISLRFRFGGAVAEGYKDALRLARERRYVPALGRLDELLEYEPYNAEALGQVRLIKQMHDSETAERRTGDPYGEALDFFRQRRYLSALDKFVEALAKQPEREAEIRRYIAIIGAEMQGEEALSAEELGELKALLAKKSTDLSAPAGADGEELKKAKRHVKKDEYLWASEILERLVRTAGSPRVRSAARESLARIRAEMTKVAASPAHPRRLYAGAFLAHAGGRAQEALMQWRLTLQDDPDDLEVGSFYTAEKRKWDKAIQQDRVKHLLQSGQAHVQEGRPDMALEVLQGAAKIEPENPEVARRVTAVREQVKQREEEKRTAEETSEVLLRQNYEKARLYYEVGQWSKAVQFLEEMMRVAPLEPKAAGLLESAREQRRLVQERALAEERARKAAAPAVSPALKPASPVRTLDPAKALSLYQRGLIAYAQGNLSEAIDIWKEALEFNPDNQRVKKALERAHLDRESRMP